MNDRIYNSQTCLKGIKKFKENFNYPMKVKKKKKHIKNRKYGAGASVRWFGALAICAEDPGLVPSTTAAHKPVTAVPAGFSFLMRVSCMLVMHIHTCRQKQSHTENKSNS